MTSSTDLCILESKIDTKPVSTADPAYREARSVMADVFSTRARETGPLMEIMAYAEAVEKAKKTNKNQNGFFGTVCPFPTEIFSTLSLGHKSHSSIPRLGNHRSYYS